MRSTLISLGWVESKFEAAFFLLWDAADNLVGLLLSHVDDTFSGGEGAYYEEQMQKLAVKIKLTFKKGTFRFCGKNVVQLEDLSIEVSQQESVENLEYMEISCGVKRRKQLSFPRRSQPSGASSALSAGSCGRQGTTSPSM